jgi:hypothetical protein
MVGLQEPRRDVIEAQPAMSRHRHGLGKVPPARRCVELPALLQLSGKEASILSGTDFLTPRTSRHEEVPTVTFAPAKSGKVADRIPRLGLRFPGRLEPRHAVGVEE